MILTNREYSPAGPDTKCGICGEKWHGIIQCIYVLKQAVQKEREANAALTAQLLTAGVNVPPVNTSVNIPMDNAFPPVNTDDDRAAYMREYMRKRRAESKTPKPSGDAE